MRVIEQEAPDEEPAPEEALPPAAAGQVTLDTA